MSNKCPMCGGEAEIERDRATHYRDDWQVQAQRAEKAEAAIDDLRARLAAVTPPEAAPDAELDALLARLRAPAVRVGDSVVYDGVPDVMAVLALCDAIDRLRADLARVAAERDRVYARVRDRRVTLLVTSQGEAGLSYDRTMLQADEIRAAVPEAFAEAQEDK